MVRLVNKRSTNLICFLSLQATLLFSFVEGVRATSSSTCITDAARRNC